MLQTPEQAAEGYRLFRGKCKEYCEALLLQNPSLTLVRGHYFCPIWGSNEAHWWLVDKDGSITDPTVRQFPSNGHGIYEPFNGKVKCSNCNKEMTEEEIRDSHSNYVFCSGSCHARFVGL